MQKMAAATFWNFSVFEFLFYDLCVLLVAKIGQNMLFLTFLAFLNPNGICSFENIVNCLCFAYTADLQIDEIFYFSSKAWFFYFLTVWQIWKSPKIFFDFCKNWKIAELLKHKEMHMVCSMWGWKIWKFSKFS